MLTVQIETPGDLGFRFRVFPRGSQAVPHRYNIFSSNSHRRRLVVIRKFSFTCSRPLRPS
jgi:hypothetical protein